MPTLRLFASARDAAGTGRDAIAGHTVGEVLATAGARYGTRFTEVLATCRVWVNGEPAGDGDAVGDGDEIAVLPPVSGGSGDGGSGDDGGAQHRSRDLGFRDAGRRDAGSGDDGPALPGPHDAKGLRL